MTTLFPGGLDALTNPTSSNTLNSPSHADQHANANDAIEALEAKVGANSSAVTTSHDYKLSEVTSSDKAVGKTATQTLSGKTLTAPQINMGSDATGDIYYRSAAGITTRLPIGTLGQIPAVGASGILEYIANPAASDASTTVKGVVEIATTAEITAGTSTGATGAILAVPASAVGAVGASKIVQFNSSTQYPAADGSLITGLTFSKPLAVQTADVVVIGSLTETDIIANVSVPANSLAAGRAIHFQAEYVLAPSGGGTAGYTIKFYFGGSSVGTASFAGLTATLGRKGTIRGTISYVGASSQYVTTMSTCLPNSADVAARCYDNGSVGSTTSAVNQANAQNAKMTVTSDSGSAGTITITGGVIRLI